MDISRTLPADVGAGLLAELLFYKALYETLCKLTSDACIELDATGRVVRWNAAAEMLTGYSAAGAIGANFREFLSDPASYSDIFASQENGVRERRFSIRDHAGKHAELRGYATALHSEKTLDGWLIACAPARPTDEIEQLKNEFVSTMSHELKTPLAVIKAYASTLLSLPAVSDSQRTEYAGVIEQQSDRLARLIPGPAAGHSRGGRTPAQTSRAFGIGLNFRTRDHPLRIRSGAAPSRYPHQQRVDIGRPRSHRRYSPGTFWITP